MELYITAYKNVKVGDSTGDWYTLKVDKEFNKHIHPFKDGDCLVGFEHFFKFRAGPLVTYNIWRNLLAELAGYEPVISERFKYRMYDEGAAKGESGPFHELINFLDFNGCIGTTYSKKLLLDFEEYKKDAERFDSPWFFEMYEKWHSAFKLAADNGVVFFR